MGCQGFYPRSHWFQGDWVALLQGALRFWDLASICEFSRALPKPRDAVHFTGPLWPPPPNPTAKRMQKYLAQKTPPTSNGWGREKFGCTKYRLLHSQEVPKCSLSLFRKTLSNCSWSRRELGVPSHHLDAKGKSWSLVWGRTQLEVPENSMREERTCSKLLGPHSPRTSTTLSPGRLRVKKLPVAGTAEKQTFWRGRHWPEGFPKNLLQTLRAKGTLISEPRFSTPCEKRFFPREKGKRPLSRVFLWKGRFPFLAWEKSHLAGGRKSGLTN